MSHHSSCFRGLFSCFITKPFYLDMIKFCIVYIASKLSDLLAESQTIHGYVGMFAMLD